MPLIKVEVNLDNKIAEQNNHEELFQRIAWKLVRSARDRYKDGQGDTKRQWAIDRMQSQCPGIVNAEDYIRAAYENYRIESKAVS